MIIQDSTAEPHLGLKPFETLMQWMAGEFSNRKQSDAEPSKFAHIRIYFRPLPFAFFNAVGFYSEQVYDYDLWSPYRQGVHRCVEQEDGSIFIENYGLNDPVLYAGASREDSILHSITPNSIVQRCGCGMVFRYSDQVTELGSGCRFIGAVEGDRCIIPRDGHQTYLVSEVELTETHWVSRDRGFDTNTQEQIWGSALGPLRFEKVRSFAHERFYRLPHEQSHEQHH